MYVLKLNSDNIKDINKLFFFFLHSRIIFKIERVN